MIVYHVGSQEHPDAFLLPRAFTAMLMTLIISTHEIQFKSSFK